MSKRKYNSCDINVNDDIYGDVGVPFSILEEQSSLSNNKSFIELYMENWGQIVLSEFNLKFTYLLDDKNNFNFKYYSLIDDKQIFNFNEIAPSWIQFTNKKNNLIVHEPSHVLCVSLSSSVTKCVDSLKYCIPNCINSIFLCYVLCSNLHDLKKREKENIINQINSMEHCFKNISNIVFFFENPYDPSPLNRLWILVELLCAIENKNTIYISLSPESIKELCVQLSKDGCIILLRIINNFKLELHTLKATVFDYEHDILINWTKCKIIELGGEKNVQIKILELIRDAYVNTIHQEYKFQLAQDKILPNFDIQLAELYSLTSNSDRSKEILKNSIIEIDKKILIKSNIDLIKYRVKLIALLGKFYRNENNIADANQIERQITTNNTLPVAWQGVSISYLEDIFFKENEKELEYLSIFGVYNRIIKPKTELKKCSFLELLDDQYVGTPTIFLSHAWRQTFHTSCGSGLIKALIDYIPSNKRPQTFVWFDIFCVNQHEKYPTGSLVAFDLDPLYNAILQSNKVLLYFDSYCDIAVLTRSWCLEEIRVSLLLNKDINVLMPSDIASKFCSIGNSFGGTKQILISEIERIVNDIDILKATATFPNERLIVIENVNNTVGILSMNKFCKEIVSKALFAVAGILHEYKSNLNEIFENLEITANNLKNDSPDKYIDILHAVGMMMMLDTNIDKNKSLMLLNDIYITSRNLYGDKSHITKNLFKCL